LVLLKVPRTRHGDGTAKSLEGTDSTRCGPAGISRVVAHDVRDCVIHVGRPHRIAVLTAKPHIELERFRAHLSILSRDPLTSRHVMNLRGATKTSQALFAKFQEKVI
jgi:hypothetical protein